MPIYRFRNCLLNTVERSLVRDNQRIELTSKMFDVLQLLVEKAGDTVTKDDILGVVWNGSFVEEGNLPVYVSKLRRSLCETRSARFIETVHGSGYRFVAGVEETSIEVWANEVEFGLPNTQQSANVASLESSIAVLPFTHESDLAGNEYLADGLTQNLINRLTQLVGLRVIARDTVYRFKHRDLDLKELSRILGVTNLVVGRMRAKANELTVNVELVDGSSGNQLWGDAYTCDLGQIVLLQQQLFTAIRHKLRLTSRERIPRFVNILTRDPESYRLYLRGKYHLERHTRADIYLAIEHFSRAIKADPENFYAHAEIVDCYRLLHLLDYISYDEFKSKTRGIPDSIDIRFKSSDIVQVMYCDINTLEWKFEEAARCCHQALAANPNCHKARLRLSDALLQSRDFPAAFEQLKIILTIDPFAALTGLRLARFFYVIGRHESAIAYLTDALELEPRSFELLGLRGAVYAEMGEYRAAMVDFEASLACEHSVDVLAMMGMVHARNGDRDAAESVITSVRGFATKHSKHSLKLAYIYLALGETETVFRYLELAYAEHEVDLRALNYDPRWNSIRTDARFQKLVKRIGLPKTK